MDWNCTLTEERLSDYIEQQLSRMEMAAFTMHASKCARCTQLIEQVGALVGRMHKLEMVDEPSNLAGNILDATLGPRARKLGWKRWINWIPVIWQPRFAMGALTVAASLAIVLHTAGVTPAKLRKADLSPTNVYRAANRQVHLTYARSVKFVNDLRVVYEIQSRLQPEVEPTPATAPSPEPKSEQPSANPQQKSQTEPHPGRSQVRASSMFALILMNDFSRSSR